MGVETTQSVLASDSAKTLFEGLLAAGDLALEMQHSGISQKAKIGKDFVTEADIAVQKLLYTYYQEHLPGLALLGEEDASHSIPDTDFLVLDPIDGTFLYAAGSDAWGITLALFQDGRPHIGFLYQPARKRLIYAHREKGCFLNGKRVKLREQAPLEKSIIALAQGCWNTEEELRSVNVPLSCASLFALCPGSAVDAGFEMIQGVVGAYLNYRGNIWDFAGLALAVEEAGGVVRAPHGGERTWKSIVSPCLFAANTSILKEVVDHIPEAFLIE